MSPSIMVNLRLLQIGSLIIVVTSIILLGPGTSLTQELKNSPLENRVAIVRGDFLGPEGSVNRARSEACFTRVEQMVRSIGIPYTVTSDSLVERHGLPNSAVAIFPYNRAISDVENQKIDNYVGHGGKVLVFFTGRSELLGWAGVRFQHWHQTIGVEADGQLILARALPGSSGPVPWRSEQVAQVALLDGSEMIATWSSKSGTNINPVIILGPLGAFFGLLPDAKSNSTQLTVLRSILGELAPQLWPHMITIDPENIKLPVVFSTLAELLARIATEIRPRAAVEQAQLANQLLNQARVALDQKDPDTAIKLVASATEAAEEAAWASYPSVPGELRGVWMHNFAEPSWPEAIANLERMHLNAVFPYMMSGGIAFYNSKVLPRHPNVARQGDYLSIAVNAAHNSNIRIHARMLNLSLLFTPNDVKQTLRAQGRLAVNDKGETQDWLCPSNPENRRIQSATALEMASYGVAGIQFDYLRYPSRSTCVCKNCRLSFEQDMGKKIARWPWDVLSGAYRGRFNTWRKQQITEIAQQISNDLRFHYPNVYVSAAVFLNWEDHSETFGQDWKKWIDKEIIDFVCPMNYTADSHRLEFYLSRQAKWINGQVPMVSGIGVYADGHEFPGPAALVEQVDVARRNGSQGFIIFNYSPALNRDYLPWLVKGITADSTTFHWLPMAMRGMITP